MNKKTQRFKRSVIHYLGELTNDNMVIMLGRDKTHENTTVTDSILIALHQQGFTSIWFETDIEYLNRNAYINPKIASYPPIIKWKTQACTLLKHPNLLRWKCQTKFSDGTAFITYRCNALLNFITTHCPQKNIILIARSSGGRVASLISQITPIKKIICLGYPFQHPDRPPEPNRITLLATTKTPTLIVQGKQDPYGGENIRQRYTFSPEITLKFIDSDHDFNVSESDYNKLERLVSTYVLDD